MKVLVQINSGVIGREASDVYDEALEHPNASSWDGAALTIDYENVADVHTLIDGRVRVGFSDAERATVGNEGTRTISAQIMDVEE